MLSFVIQTALYGKSQVFAKMNNTDLKLKEPIEILLKVLLAGHTVFDLDGKEYGMDEDCHLCIKAQRFTPGSVVQDPEEIWVQVPCDVSELKIIADRIGRDALWLKACGTSLRPLS